MVHRVRTGHSELRKALLKKTGWSKQRLSQLVQKKHRQLPMSTPVAQAVIAHERGLRLAQYLGGDELREAQDTVARLSGINRHDSMQGAARLTATSSKLVDRNRTIAIPSEFRIDDPILSPAKLMEAREMAQMYPLLYVIENSLREVIQRVMVREYGDDWWNSSLTSGQAKGVKDRAGSRLKKEESQPWHQRRGAHPLDYVDLEDLRIIAVSKPNLFFPHILGEQPWFENFIRELNSSRCVLCHMNPLSKDNVQDLRLKSKRWQKLISAAITRLQPVPPRIDVKRRGQSFEFASRR